MANLMDYLDWRGDLTLEISPFNEVDALILAELSFVDFDGIVPPPARGRGPPRRQLHRQSARAAAQRFIIEQNAHTDMPSFSSSVRRAALARCRSFWAAAKDSSSRDAVSRVL